MTTENISKRLIEKGLKVTPQRLAIFEAVILLENHPTADQILEYIRRKNPHIALATIYKVLDVLVENHLIKMVLTDKDIKRYDAVTENHHHLYYVDSEEIEDYIDEELNELLNAYFRNKEISGFRIEEIKLQIVGTSKPGD